jgi:hypothetical protein
VGKKPENFESTIIFLAKVLAGRSYAFRGTTSLVLQGYDMNVDDIDILCDKDTSLDANSLLKDYLVKEVVFSETNNFRSYFGSFFVNGVKVEVMGNWEIKDPKGIWKGPYVPESLNTLQLSLDDTNVVVTTADTELKAFTQMGRWNAYKKLKNQIDHEKDPTN